MPRFDDAPRATKIAPPPPAPRRHRALPWRISEQPGTFVVLDANGVELHRVQFVPSEQRKLFPTGLTYEEARLQAEWQVRTLEQEVEAFEESL